MTISQALAGRIEELLKEKNMTQYRLAMESGASHAIITDILHCKNKSTSLLVVYNIAQAFGMDLDQFFDTPLFKDGNITD